MKTLLRELLQKEADKLDRNCRGTSQHADALLRMGKLAAVLRDLSVADAMERFGGHNLGYRSTKCGPR